MKLSFPLATRVFRFYYNGFKEMSQWGRRVWIIILIKLFIIFIILKVFFFRDFLNEKYDSDAQKSEYVLNQITNSNQPDD